jgi:flagellar biosynthesis component FlhA
VEYTKLLKFGAAIIALLLIGKGLVVGFDFLATALSVALIFVCYKMDQNLTMTERSRMEERFNEMSAEHQKLIKQLSEKQSLEKAELQQKLENLESKLHTFKVGQQITKRL